MSSFINAPVLFEGKDISCSYGMRVILHDVNITLHNNEIVTVIGPNGSGKTTLVKVVLGLLSPNKGMVRCKEGITVGYMPQKLVIDPVLPITVQRFLMLRPLGKVAFQKEKMAAIAKETGISHILSQQVANISGGEMQRMMLARALLLEPDLLVLDEPVQALDIHGQTEFYRLIERIRQTRHCGILMVSHDLHMVMAKTDHVICINHHVCCEGTPEDVSKHQEYLTLFGREHAGNVAVYTHSHNHEHGIGGEVIE